MARRRKSRQAVRVRKRSIRRRSASRHRRRGRSRHRREGAGLRHRDLRGHRADGRQDALDPDSRRLHGHAPASRIAVDPERRGGERRRPGRDGRDERRDRLARALRLPRDPGHRGRPGIRRSAHTAAGAARAGPWASIRRRRGAVTRAGGCPCALCSNAHAPACSRVCAASYAGRCAGAGGEPVSARGRPRTGPCPGTRARGGAARAGFTASRFRRSPGRIGIRFGVAAGAHVAGAQSVRFARRPRRTSDRVVRQPS